MAIQEGRKAITGNDVFKAAEMLEMPFIIPELKAQHDGTLHRHVPHIRTVVIEFIRMNKERRLKAKASHMDKSHAAQMDTADEAGHASEAPAEVDVVSNPEDDINALCEDDKDLDEVDNMAESEVAPTHDDSVTENTFNAFTEDEGQDNDNESDVVDMEVKKYRVDGSQSASEEDIE